MKIYSDILTSRDLHGAAPPGVYVNEEGSAPARLRKRRFDKVRLASNHGSRWPNSGTSGARSAAAGAWGTATPLYHPDTSAPKAATYDEHGVWMARLFDIDPDAIIIANGRYESRYDFHDQTEWKYGIPVKASVV